ncbi:MULTISPECIES: hypothetical protein [unclassified Dokdonia]|uniref:hypothetical protein n=1 Tax=unclassified Dokdonia TaxID=2615033 RepID=UPI0003198FB5|nr:MULTISPECIES: hypothetical protein [unclassified Dokdonia]
MIDNISFIHEEWMWPVIAGAVILWGLFIWKELRVTGSKYVMIKAIIALIAVASLALMLLQPVKTVPRTKGVGIILTEAYKQQQLDSLQVLYKDIEIIKYDGDGFNPLQLEAISTAYILGNGVASYDIWQIQSIATTYLTGERLSGITKLAYNKSATVGDSLSIRGIYTSPIKGNRLLLEDAGGNELDSVTVSGGDAFDFELQATTSVSGKYVYKLIEKDSLSTIISEDPLPLIIKEKERLRVLIINGFPTFETKYLKNYLADEGHEVLVRSQLTKERYKFENFNRKQGVIYGFTSANLSAFDVVVMDASSYNGLSSGSRRTLNNQVSQEGLGVFIQPDVAVVNDGKQFGFRFKRNNKNEIALSTWPKVKVATILYSFDAGALVQPIISEEGNVWAAYAQRGAGRWGSTTLTDTYQLILDGNEATYNYLWSSILSAVSQKELPTVLWEFQEEIGVKDAPFRFKLRTEIPAPKVLDNEQVAIPLRQDVLLEDQWEGTVYPSHSGWNELRLAQDSTAVASFYIPLDTDWKSLRTSTQIAHNKRTFNVAQKAAETHTVLEPVERLWLFVIFILAMGYLWVAPRLEGV